MMFITIFFTFRKLSLDSIRGFGIAIGVTLSAAPASRNFTALIAGTGEEAFEQRKSRAHFVGTFN